ncbi:hypothetical protein AFAE65S_03695 [Alcaligenes phenolicus]
MNKETKPKGQHLRLALRATMRQRAESVSGVAKQVGISQSYLSQLINGDKPMEHVSDQHLRRLAAYLGMPPIAGFVLAGRLSVSDFLESVPPVEQRLDQALKAVLASSTAAEAQVSEADVGALPVSVKMWIVLLHQRAERIDLFRPSAAWWASRRVMLQD